MKMLEPNDSAIVSKDVLKDLNALLDKQELGPEEIEDLEGFILTCTDQAAMVQKELEDEVKRLRSFAKEFAEAARRTETRLEKLLDFARLTLEQRGTDDHQGSRFEMVLRTCPPKVIMNTPYPTAFDAEAYPGIVRTKTTYEWDKIAVREIMKTHDIPFARVVQDTRVEFQVRKGACA